MRLRSNHMIAIASTLMISLGHREVTATVETGPIRAGADARTLCTLTDVPLAGYGNLDRRKTIPLPRGHTFLFKPMEGVHDPVRVKSVVLEVNGQRIAIVGIDAVGLPANVFEQVGQRLADIGLSRGSIMLTATHTHSGPGAVIDRLFWQIAAADTFNENVFNHIVGNIEASIRNAIARLEPARLGVATRNIPGITRNRRHDNGPVNNELAILKITNRTSAPLAVVFHYAVHGTSLGSSNLMMSADNMGYAERFLESEIVGAVALFINGAEGDVKPNGGGFRGFEGARYTGEQLGTAVKTLWDDTTTRPTATLETAHLDVELPDLAVNLAKCEQTLASLIEEWSVALPGELGETQEMFMALRINDSAWVAVPGEPITEIGTLIQQRVLNHGFNKALVVGLANGHMGYITTPEEYDIGGYESCATLHGRNTGPFVVDSASSAALLLTPPSADTPADAGITNPPDAAGAHTDASASFHSDAGRPSLNQEGATHCGCHHGGANNLLLILLAGLFATYGRPRTRGSRNELL